jgi:transcriptional accessory protein Tex/SPT6
MMMFVKEKQQERKSASRVQRLLSFDDRTPLAALIPGMEMSGLVISLTNFGAYVDVGTQCVSKNTIYMHTPHFFVSTCCCFVQKEIMLVSKAVTRTVHAYSYSHTNSSCTSCRYALDLGRRLSLLVCTTKMHVHTHIHIQDGLLHISQISRDFFVEHPRQVLTPGDEIAVQVRSVDASRNKLHLTMLPRDVWVAEKEQQRTQQLTRNSNDNSAENDNHFLSDRIPLAEIQVDDELWGELRRVTDYGAYVEVGAVVDGWLHFMDHPEAACHVGGAPQGLQQKSKQQQQQQRPSDFMKVGDRVRVWVADVNHEQQRIKLTALRPPHLPGPRREL